MHRLRSGYGVSAAVVERIRSRLSALNRLIADDARNLGAGFCIGHSFFCPTQNVADSEAWYEEVVETEVRPLLEEYWADGSSDRTVEEIQKLLDA